MEVDDTDRKWNATCKTCGFKSFGLLADHRCDIMTPAPTGTVALPTNSAAGYHSNIGTVPNTTAHNSNIYWNKVQSPAQDGPVICPICGVSSKNRNSLKTHKSTYHRKDKNLTMSNLTLTTPEQHNLYLM